MRNGSDVTELGHWVHQNAAQNNTPDFYMDSLRMITGTKSMSVLAVD